VSLRPKDTISYNIWPNGSKYTAETHLFNSTDSKMDRVCSHVTLGSPDCSLVTGK
jgi:hypothetical protein